MTHPHEIAFIDPAITDFDTLLSGLRPDVEAIVLSQAEPAIAQMARALEGRTKLDAIHVIAHGQPGEVSFAAGALSVETIEGETAGLGSFGAALGAEGALSIWACETGAGERGAAFTDALAEETGARVATASGLVGAAARGGTWALDRGVGASRSPLTAEGMAAYAGVMATFTGTNGNDIANATTGTLTGFSGGTVAQLQDSTGDIFNGGTGADTIVAGSGDDTINIANGQFVSRRVDPGRRQHRQRQPRPDRPDQHRHDGRLLARHGDGHRDADRQQRQRHRDDDGGAAGGLQHRSISAAARTCSTSWRAATSRRSRCRR